jgi:hypothetical protein
MQSMRLVALRLLSLVSNVMAWLLVTLGVLAALSAPLGAYMHARLREFELPEHYFMWLALCGVLTATGALLVLKRKPIGVLLSLAPAFAYWAWGSISVALLYTLGVLLFLGLPVLIHKALTTRPKTGVAVG